MVSWWRNLTAVKRTGTVLVLVVAFLVSLDVAMAGPRSDSEDTFPQMLEISTRPWLFELSQKYGKNLTTFASIPDAEFVAIRKQGYKVVWMMGVWALGTSSSDSFLRERSSENFLLSRPEGGGSKLGVARKLFCR
jgi:hypothetical protein